MKKLLLISSLFAFATVAMAGGNTTFVTSKDSKSTTIRNEIYRSGETQIDVFGDYSAGTNRHKNDRFLKQDHAFGASLAVNHFFTRNLGVGVEGSYIGTHAKSAQVMGDVIARVPIGGTKFAPYAVVGGGTTFGKDRDARATAKAGLGLEYRFAPNMGIKTDYSYNMVNGSHNNFGMARTGISIDF